MFNVIVAVSKQLATGKLGIGRGNQMAWKCKQELNLFKQKTMGNVLIMGKNTVQGIPKLDGRVVYCLTRDKCKMDRNTIVGKNRARVFTNFEDALRDAKEKYPEKEVFVAGGEVLYNYVMQYQLRNIRYVHISYMHQEHKCDKFFPDMQEDVICVDHQKYDEFDHYVLDPNSYNIAERQYLDLLKKILDMGAYKEGRNGRTLSLFSEHLKFDLREGFPLLTTKKMFFRGIVEEFLFFLRGETDSKLLEDKGINIWKGNTSREFLDSLGMTKRREGVMGPCFVDGTLVLTKNGYKPIETVSETDVLYTHLGNWKPILQCMKRKYNDSLIKLKVKYHRELTVTPEHPFYCKTYTVKDRYNGKRSVPIFENPRWIEAKDLTKRCVIGMKIEQAERIPVFGNIRIETENQWFMLGYFLGDGWLQSEGKDRERICFAINDKQQEEIVDRISDVLNIQLCETYDHCYKYRCSNKSYNEVLRSFRKYAHGKIIPDWVHTAPRHMIKWFLEGYLAADGGIVRNRSSVNDSKRFTTTSADIAYSIQRLYLKLGHIASINFQKRSCYKNVFRNKESYLHNVYNIEVYENIVRRGNYSHIENDYVWFDVSAIEEITPTQPVHVYNFDVQDDHTYVVENLSVHNCYGYQWRYFNAEYNEENAKPLEKGVDQLQNVINLIESDPDSRRIMMTAFNPAQIHQCVLPPCHSVFLQFYVQNGYIDMFAMNRSSDIFLGAPFNIASYALLLYVVSKITNLTPRYLNMTLGDTHIYEDHISVVKSQIERYPFNFPVLDMKNITSIEDAENLSFEDFILKDYKHHSTIKAKMIA